MVAQNKYVDEVLPHAPWIIGEGTRIAIQHS